MTQTLTLVPPHARTRARPASSRLLSWLWSVVRDVAYGVNAGNAIRHGLPAPRRPTRQERRPRAPQASGVPSSTAYDVIVLTIPPSKS